MRINQYKTILDKETLLGYLVKEHGFNYNFNKKMSSPEEVYRFMEDVYQLSYESVEKVYLLACDIKYNLIGVFKISEGTVNYSVIPSREIFIKALLCNAVNIIIVHNHPSQDTSPSSDDLSVTKTLKEAGNLLGINLQDHIIIGKGYYSFRANGNI